MGLSREEMKKALKEALKEWLDEKFAQFGKWSLAGIAAAALVLLAWGCMALNGWHKP